MGAAAVALTLVIGGGASAQASAPDREQQQAFAALRGAPVKSASSSVERLIDSKSGRATGVDGANVYRVKSPTGGAWALLPGKGGICLVLEDREGISTCASTSDAKAGKLRVLLITPEGHDAIGGEAVQAGLLPDAAASATVTLTTGTILPVDVGDRGQYAIASGRSARPTALRMRTTAGSVLKRRPSWAGRRDVTPLARVASFGSFCHNPTLYCTFSGSAWDGPYTVTSSSVASGDGNWICGNLVEPNGTWAGTTYCANTSTLVTHPWNGSSRTVWAGPGVAGVPVYGFGTWLY